MLARRLIPLAAIVALGASACSSSSSTTAAAPSVAMSASHAVELASTTTGAAASVHSDVTEQIAVGIGGQSQNVMVHLVGDEQRSPLEAQMAVTVPHTGDIEMRIVDGKIYVRLPTSAQSATGGKAWGVVALADGNGAGSLLRSQFSSMNPMSKLSGEMAAIRKSVKDLGPATVNGVAVTHYQASVPLGSMLNSLLGKEPQIAKVLAGAHMSNAVLDLYVDSSHLVRRESIALKMSVSMPVLGSMAMDMNVTANFSNYGESVHVSAPPAADTAPLSLPGAKSLSGLSGLGSLASL